MRQVPRRGQLPPRHDLILVTAGAARGIDYSNCLVEPPPEKDRHPSPRSVGPPGSQAVVEAAAAPRLGARPRLEIDQGAPTPVARSNKSSARTVPCAPCQP